MTTVRLAVSVSLLLQFTSIGSADSDPRGPGDPDARTIIERSVAANQVDWTAAPDYEYVETDRDKDSTRAYHVTMMLGTPYRRLLSVGGQPLSKATDQSEQNKFERELARRRSESASERAKRLKSYADDRNRDRVMMAQISTAFDFVLVGHQNVDGHDTYVLQATPRRGYKPPNARAEALTGMRGQLWIDTATYNWAKVSAQVVHAVSIAGFLARVEPGTSFELDETPVGGPGGTVWLPKHFLEQSRSQILGIFSHRTRGDETYSSYRKASPE